MTNYALILTDDTKATIDMLNEIGDSHYPYIVYRIATSLEEVHDQPHDINLFITYFKHDVVPLWGEYAVSFLTTRNKRIRRITDRFIRYAHIGAIKAFCKDTNTPHK